MNPISRIFRRLRVAYKEDVRPYDVTMWNYRRFSGDVLEIDLIRACIDALARNIAKMQLQPVLRQNDGQKNVDTSSDIAKVLAHPNPFMTTYDFLYKVAALYYAGNNVFLWPEYEDGHLVALWPIFYRQAKTTVLNGNLYVSFDLKFTRSYTCPWDDLIVLRNHYITDEVFGEPNNAILPACELLDAQNQGIINGIKNSATIRGILKSLNVLKESDLRKAKEQFVQDNLSIANSGGVIAIDGKFDYQNIESKPYTVDAESMNAAKQKIFDYFGVNEEFLQNNFTAEKYEAVYEGRLEPFAIMLTQALTYGLYTERERAFGREIEASMAKLKYQPIDKITAMISATNQLGLFRRNEYREMLGYGPLTNEEGGNEILISLNYVKATNLDEYQEVDSNDE